MQDYVSFPEKKDKICVDFLFARLRYAVHFWDN